MRRHKRRGASERQRDRSASWVREFSDLLHSCDEGLHFTAAFRVEWQRPADGAVGPASPGDAGRPVRLLAESLASQRSILRYEATEQDINHELRRRLPWTIDGVEIVWANVTLSIDEHARTCAARIARLRSEEELAELARHQVSARIRFMQEEILRTPATARLYLMLEQAGQELPSGTDVDALVKAVQQWHPQAQWVVVAQLLHTFLGNLNPRDAGDLLGTLRALFLEYGEKELAEQLPIGEPVPEVEHRT
ncbi:hypothetical protein [Streptomyces sp. NPDC003023]|uniref:hypothetical protein n=1 Tax=Streptomyces sp. NPDC003023 TaxID=3364675 RepID=UPI0036B73433